MPYDIRHNAVDTRFETVVDGKTAVAEYRIRDGRFDILHTIVPRAVEGRGIGSALVGAAYDFARRNGLEPVATCSFAAAWLDRHPDYAAEPVVGAR